MNNKLNDALNNLEKGNLIIYPTDTLYGLGADATNTLAVQKINALKKRKSPLSIMVQSIDEIQKYAIVNQNKINTIKKILPGPFTVLLKTKKSNLSHLIDNGTNKIGIRIPNNKFCLKLLKKYKKPIVTTSVNIHGKPALNKVDEIKKVFFNIYIYEEQINENSKGSTIVDFTINPLKIIREGDGKHPL